MTCKQLHHTVVKLTLLNDELKSFKLEKLIRLRIDPVEAPVGSIYPSEESDMTRGRGTRQN